MYKFLVWFLFPFSLCASDIFDDNQKSSDDKMPLLTAINDSESFSEEDEKCYHELIIEIENLPQEEQALNLKIHSLSMLPEELLLSIFRLCPKEALLQCLLVSKAFKSQIRRFIPKLSLLPKNPSCVKLLAFLNDVEQYEKDRQPLYSEFQSLYEIYFYQLQRWGALKNVYDILLIFYGIMEVAG